MKSTMVASVVLLPEPVGPVTRIRPRGRQSSFWMRSLRPISSNVSNLNGISRRTTPTLPRCLKTATRKRACFPKENPKSVEPPSCSSC